MSLSCFDASDLICVVRRYSCYLVIVFDSCKYTGKNKLLIHEYSLLIWKHQILKTIKSQIYLRKENIFHRKWFDISSNDPNSPKSDKKRRENAAIFNKNIVDFVSCIYLNQFIYPISGPSNSCWRLPSPWPHYFVSLVILSHVDQIIVPSLATL